MDDPRDLCSFGLACRLFQAITQTGMVWRQLLGSTYGWVFDQWQAHMDLKQLGWRDAYRVCRKTACARVNVRRLFQKGACSTNSVLNLGTPFGCFAVDCTEVVNDPDLVAVHPQANGRANNIELWEKHGDQAALECTCLPLDLSGQLN
ncbi:uncharacterized protein ACA1_334640 [Acanthamoeba castellanii str. Neff]|uniref:Fbox domain containing protein n=1 Tax=Acanthamoeba castellanii (strain ATCC 30010 / Neff) TaxID=1257118 RepID=L8GE32_ACACF|nr:uncharacterized protein ACA1_334640 [Acanthamoeba castellanii str. Neff]ELR11084.1 hypothetical protein ACA1_334640 [Acanthamoeba castellanii str. Neff]